MKKTIYFLSLLAVLSARLTAQNWLWSKPQGISTTSITTGNVKISPTGSLIAWQALNAGGTYITASNANGDTLWKKYYAGLVISDMCFNASGEIWFSGTFTGTVSLGTSAFVSAGGRDAILGRLSAGGTLVAARSFGTASSEYALSIAADGANVYCGGSFIASQTIDGIHLNNINTWPNAFILKFDASLNATAGAYSDVWCCYGAEAFKIAVDRGGKVYMLGNSESALSIGTYSTYIAEGGQFLAGFDQNLNVLSLRTVNAHYMGGWYRPFMFFDQSNNMVLAHVTGGGGGATYDLKIEKYDTAGTLMWGKPVSVNMDYFVDTDAQDNIWVAGREAIYVPPVSFSLAKVSTSGVLTSVIYDPTIKHVVQGLAVKAPGEFYMIYDCDGGSSLNGNGCSTDGSLAMAYYGPIVTAVKEKEKEKETSGRFIIYPNPANGNVIISCTSSGVKKACTLSVRNALGALVYSEGIKEQSGPYTKKIDLSAQPAGMYFVELTDDCSNDAGKEQVRELRKIILE